MIAPSTGELLAATPPQNLDAERALLASVLLHQDCLDDVATVVKAIDFYEERHAMLFAAAMEIHNAGKRLDAVILAQHFQRAKKFDSVGGAVYLAELIHAAPTAAHAVYYANIVRDCATMRELRQSGQEVIRLGHSDLEARDALNQAESSVLAIRERRGSGGDRIRTAGDVLQDAMVELAKRREGGGAAGLATGFTDIDRMMRLRGGELIILAARPSMGKTALALNIAVNVATAGAPVLFVSLEMSSALLADRLLCATSRVDGNRMRDGSINQYERQAIVQACAELSNIPLVIDDTPTRTALEIAALARRQKRRDGLGLIVVDYLTLIQPDNPRDVREQQVSRIAGRLKALARELSVPVLCLAQLNRAAETAKDLRPRLSNLRESGAIEQDADIVAFLHREAYYATSAQDRAAKENEADLLIAKHRNGATGDVKLHWFKECTLFVSAARPQPDNYESSFDAFNER